MRQLQPATAETINHALSPPWLHLFIYLLFSSLIVSIGAREPKEAVGV